MKNLRLMNRLAEIQIPLDENSTRLDSRETGNACFLNGNARPSSGDTNQLTSSIINLSIINLHYLTEMS